MNPHKETGWADPVMRVKAKFLRSEEPLRHATVTGLLPRPKMAEKAARKTKRDASSSEPPLPTGPIDQRSRFTTDAWPR